MKSFLQSLKEAPGHLRFIAILSLMNIGYSLFANVLNFMNGPQSKEQVRKMKADIYAQATQAEEIGGTATDWVVDMTDKMAKMVEYTNANFTLNAISSIVILIIGLVGVLFMLQRRIVGFHLYIIYSLAAVGQVYIIAPAGDVPTFMIGTNLLIAAMFVLMYARHHKWIQNQIIDKTN